MHRRKLIQAAGVASASLFAGCSGNNVGGENGTVGTGTTTSTEKKELRIGAPFPYTGPYSPQAQFGFEAVELAAKTLRNDPEFEHPVRVFTADTELSPSKTVEIFRRMIDENDINLMTGTVSSSSGLAASPLSKQYKITMTTPNNALDHFAGKCHKYKFPVGKPSQDLIRYTAPMIFELDLGTRWYSVNADYAFGQDLKAQTKETAKNTDGYEYVGGSDVPFGHGDYSQVFQKARNQDAEVLFLSNFGIDTTTAAKQAIANGLHKEMNVVIPQMNYVTMNKLPPEGRQHLYAGLAWFHDADIESVQAFTKKFESQLGRPPTMMNGLFYNLVMLPAAAIKETGIDADAISDALEGRTLTINTGEETIRPCDHYPQAANFVVKGKSPDDQSGKWDLFEAVDTGGSGPPGVVTPEDVPPMDCSPKCNLS